MITTTVDLELDITEQDITEGIPGDPVYCPIALALYRVTNHLWSVRNTEARCHYKDTILHLPKEAQNFIQLFDEKLPVEPKTFTVAMPQEAMQ